MVQHHCSPHVSRAKWRFNWVARSAPPLAEGAMRNNLPDQFASMILALRQSGLGRTEIAARTGISRAHLYRLAVGDIRRPSHETVSRLEKLQAQVVKSVKPVA